MIRRSIFLSHILTAAVQENQPAAALLHQTRALGYDGVDADYAELAPNPQLQQMLKDAGLSVASLYHFCHFEKGFDVEDMQRFLAFARSVQCTTVLIIPGFFTEDGDREREMQAMTDGLNQTCSMAKDYGVTVTVEDFGDRLSPCCHLKDLKYLFGQVGDLKATFDTGNFLFDGVEVLEAFEALEDRIRHVHLKDRLFEPLTEGDVPDLSFTGEPFYSVAAGSGMIPMEEIIRRLKQKGYDGYLAVEHFGAQREWDYVQRSARWLDTVL